MNNYEIALQTFAGIVKATETPMQSFDRKNYHGAFLKIYEQMVPGFDALQALYTSVKEPDTLLDNMAGAVVEAAQQELEACKKRSQKEIRMMNLNMQLAVFINPAILYYKGDFSKALTERIGVKWKEAFPKTNVQIADIDTIEKGFRRKFCYITTAVCRTFGKPDDCYELNAFRRYRDDYLMNIPGGEEMIHRYYDIAPTIVKHIDATGYADEIYRNIWEEDLRVCLSEIENGEFEQCADHYRQMVERMYDRYFFVSDAV